ncbi:MAG: NTP transferase domain-containing protein [Nitrospirota bacterium]|nr:NTP transferase domain-containing protein [Nitrospirota bacterium]
MRDEVPSLWGVVLAGGEGKRLRGFVRDYLGTDAPKQFCAFLGRRSMVEHTLRRVTWLVPWERLFLVATERHRPYVVSSLGARQAGTVLFQPVGRDTGPGILLSLLHVLRRDPNAVVAIFPSDHFIMPGRSFMKAVEEAAKFLAWNHLNMTITLAVQPTDANVEYGWIEPGPPVAVCGDGTLKRMAAFVEKPPVRRARKLLEAGWLWNTMVIVGRVRALIQLIRRACPELAAYFSLVQRALGTTREAEVVRMAYRMIPSVNFSAAVLAPHAEQLLILPIDNVLWGDWGKKEHILETLQRLGKPLSAPLNARHAAMRA